MPFLLLAIAYITSIYGNLFKLFILVNIASIFLMIYRININSIIWSNILRPFLILIPFYLYLLISCFYTNDPLFALWYGFVALTLVLTGYAFGILIALLYSLEKIILGFAFVIISFIAMSALNYHNTGDPMIYQIGSENKSIRSLYAGFFVLIAPLLIGLSIIKTGVTKWLLILFFLANIVALNQSRSIAFISIPLCLFLVINCSKKKFAKILIIGLILTIIVLIKTTVTEENKKFPLFDRLFNETSLNLEGIENEINFQALGSVDIERRLVTKVSLDSFFDHPILGIGFTGIWQRIIEVYDLNISAHGYSGLAGELGLLGVIIFLLTVIKIIKKFRKILLKPGLLKYDQWVLNYSLNVSFISVLLFGFFHQVVESYIFGLSIGLLLGSILKTTIGKKFAK